MKALPQEHPHTCHLAKTLATRFPRAAHSCKLTGARHKVKDGLMWQMLVKNSRSRSCPLPEELNRSSTPQACTCVWHLTKDVPPIKNTPNGKSTWRESMSFGKAMATPRTDKLTRTQSFLNFLRATIAYSENDIEGSCQKKNTD